MQLQTEQVVHLVNAQGQQLGQIVIERREDKLVFGRFIPGPAFPAVQHLFRQFEEAVNLQALSVVDELDAAITALDLHLRTPEDSQCIAAYDVQIWSDGSITCRVGSSASPTENRSPGKR